MMDLLGYTRTALIDYVRDNFAKGKYYGNALFRELYGNPDRSRDRETNPAFESFYKSLVNENPLPPVTGRTVEDETVKFLLDMGEGYSSESVLIPMRNYSTLCVSSQIGCRFACRFCATGQMGFVRHLSTAEIMAQVLRARFSMDGSNLQNIVFMGMGEPFDNFDNVIRAIDIISDERGLNIPKRRISVSTAGHCGGIRRLTELCRDHASEYYHTLHLSISLHSAVEKTRNSLMPIGHKYPLNALREAVLNSPYSRVKDGLYIEYLLIPGLTDTDEEMAALMDFLRGMQVKINLIPYNRVKGSPWKAPTNEEINRIWSLLKDAGFYCRTRLSKGDTMMAACGQLGGRRKTNEYTG